MGILKALYLRALSVCWRRWLRQHEACVRREVAGRPGCVATPLPAPDRLTGGLATTAPCAASCAAGRQPGLASRSALLARSLRLPARSLARPLPRPVSLCEGGRGPHVCWHGYLLHDPASGPSCIQGLGTPCEPACHAALPARPGLGMTASYHRGRREGTRVVVGGVLGGGRAGPHLG